MRWNGTFERANDMSWVLTLALLVPMADRTWTEVPASGTVRPVRTADGADFPTRFRLGTEPFAFVTKQEYEHAAIRKFSVTFPSPVTTPHPLNNTVHAEYFQPAGKGPHPGIVVLHILGGDFPLSRLVANHLAQRGLAALFVKMPHYGPRRDPALRKRMISKNPVETVEGMTQAVLDIRRATDWLADRPEVDPRRLGITGISLGGIMSSLAGGVDTRFRKVGIVLGGGDFAEFVWNVDHPEAAEFRQTWTSQCRTRDEFAKLIAEIDPVTYGPRLAARRVLMIEAAHDEVIPPAHAKALYDSIRPTNAVPGPDVSPPSDTARPPELVWLNAGHYTAIWYLPRELMRLDGFFRGKW
jgi:cephalosporin-C deacetylase-like acetyl esterase